MRPDAVDSKATRKPGEVGGGRIAVMLARSIGLTSARLGFNVVRVPDFANFAAVHYEYCRSPGRSPRFAFERDCPAATSGVPGTAIGQSEFG